MTYHGNKELWKPLKSLIYKNFPSNFPFDYIYLCSDKIISERIFNFNFFNESSWIQRLKLLLLEIKSEYILLLLDDYFPLEKTNPSYFNLIIDFIKNNKPNYLRVINNPFLLSFTKISKINSTSNYQLNLQPSFWNVSFLIKIINDYEMNPWQFEKFLLNESSHKTNLFFYNSNLFQIHNGLLRGEWFPKTYKLLLNNGYFSSTSKKKLSKIDYFIYNFKSLFFLIVPLFLKKIIRYFS